MLFGGNTNPMATGTTKPSAGVLSEAQVPESVRKKLADKEAALKASGLKTKEDIKEDASVSTIDPAGDKDKSVEGDGEEDEAFAGADEAAAAGVAAALSKKRTLAAPAAHKGQVNTSGLSEQLAGRTGALSQQATPLTTGRF